MPAGHSKNGVRIGAGMFVNVWTINTAMDMKTCIIKGVDVITTNSSSDLMNLL